MNNQPEPIDNEALINAASVDLTPQEQNRNFLPSAPQSTAKALEKINAITSVIDGAKKIGFSQTKSQDWVKMGDKFYLQASGVEKGFRSIFGIYFMDVNISRENFDDGEYAYICHGKAGSSLLDKLYGVTIIEIEGSRSSKDPFFSAHGRTPDPMDVRKSAYANFQTRAVKALLGLGNYTESDLKSFGVPISSIQAIKYEQGSEGGKTAQNAEFISEAQRKRLFVLCREGGFTESALKDILQKKYGIDSTHKIKRHKMYEEICDIVQSGRVIDVQDETVS